MSTFANYLQSTPTPSTPPQGGIGGFVSNNIINPIKDAFSGAVNKITSGYKETQAPTSNPISAVGNLFKGGAHMAEGAVGIPASLAAPVINPTVGAATNAISDTVSNNPSVQQFAMSPAGQTTANVASGVSTTANIAGGVTGLMGAGEVAGNIWDRAYNSTGESKVNVAETARNNAATEGVSNLQNMTEKVGGFKADLGTNFKQGAADIEAKNPNLKLNLTSDQVDALNTLKNNKSFALPDYLRVDATPQSLADIGGKTSLTPSQTQDLITQLNKSTFTERSSGLAVDQSKIGLTNEIKQAAQQQFGDQWKKVYSDYSQGINAVDKLSDIVNLNKDATPSDIHKSLNSVLKLSDSPEGKIILQNAVNEFKNVSGIDLTQGTQAIGQILDKQTALEEASKPGFLKKIADPVYLGKSAVRYGVIYLGLKAIINALKTQ